MIDAAYWWDEAAKFKGQAQTSEHPDQQKELLELAKVCEEVAAEFEERATSG